MRRPMCIDTSGVQTGQMNGVAMPVVAQFRRGRWWRSRGGPIPHPDEFRSMFHVFLFSF